MAQVDLSGFNGSVTLPTAHGGQAKGFTIRRSASKKNTGRYGSGRFSQGRLGVVTISGDINVFLRMGASNTSPGVVAPAADGSSLTLTLETGCSLSGTALFPDFNATHA